MVSLYIVHTSWLSLLRTSPPNLKKNKKKTSTLTLKKSVKNKTGSSENTWSVTTTEYLIYQSMSNLSVCQVLQVLTLLIWIRVGIRILREVEGQHLANDAVSLLWTEEKAKQI